MTKKEFIEEVDLAFEMAYTAAIRDKITDKEYLAYAFKRLELLAPMVTDDEKEDED